MVIVLVGVRRLSVSGEFVSVIVGGRGELLRCLGERLLLPEPVGALRAGAEASWRDDLVNLTPEVQMKLGFGATFFSGPEVLAFVTCTVDSLAKVSFQSIPHLPFFPS
jgi:hypothetical protein